jgi:NAD(P)H-flavin reductase
VFHDELDDIASGERPALKVVHVLSRAGDDWEGETGHVDGEKLKRYAGEVSGKTFYVCGPIPMLEATVAALKSMGVPDGRIRTEIFRLID